MRVGVVVPKFGHTAVRRNQVKRRLRELARTMILTRGEACDVVVWALPGAYRRTMAQLSTAMRDLVDRIGRGDSAEA
jgi:ribonuclease P protein component